MQAAPIPFAINDGMRDLVAHVEPLAASGVAIAAFGESFIGGYPLWFDSAPGAAMWQAKGAKALHRILLDRALCGGDDRLAPLQLLVDASEMLVSFGAHERVGNSLFNTQYLMRPSAPPLLHRKLVPTHGERLIWGQGDGSTLKVHEAPWGRIGSLICWEHWMPLVRAAMHHERECVHVAAWPTLNDAHLLASRHYAFEGRCFVLAAATIQTREDLLDGLARVGGDTDAETLLRSMPETLLQHGGSAIIGPDGTVMAQAGAGPQVLHAHINVGRIGEELTTFDANGHYSRPDIFRLSVDREARIDMPVRA
ncbi:nitrilase-related carbon-nitrogen hydrolase [Sphingomonas sp.]|uniref:nitrilase-related carbon-nitrogen hydrolase n=1 Tax=Sphingomonas sp. TaxID=28214 RepID=UPI0025FC36F3|nr:nitrilase-related carbon-nitrogen hydrolase [Sphingomonas sp.]